MRRWGIVIAVVAGCGPSQHGGANPTRKPAARATLDLCAAPTRCAPLDPIEGTFPAGTVFQVNPSWFGVCDVHDPDKGEDRHERCGEVEFIATVACDGCRVDPGDTVPGVEPQFRVTAAEPGRLSIEVVLTPRSGAAKTITLGPLTITSPP